MATANAGPEYRAAAAIVSGQYRVNAQRVTRIAEGYSTVVPFGFQVAGLLAVQGVAVVKKMGVI